MWTSTYARFFGDEELALLRTLGALTGLALDRVNLLQAEHETRLALERANEAQRAQVRDALLQQTQRMVALVEQLLDLSRLDAEAIDIVPEPIHVRDHVREIVATVAPEPGAVDVAIGGDTIAVADRNALERIVSNLVTNAFRYGTPPVTVRAEQTDHHFRLSVEDRGLGVAAEFVPDLFERFSRGGGSQAGSVGTGLGLAIARSYARAHGGDLLYEDATPHGARFLLVLPAEQRRA